MKRAIVVIAMLVVPFVLFAQSNMQDVIYLKNGNIYKGIIIEQVPNVSYKIQSKDGNVFAVLINEIEKITKEKRERQYHHGYHAMYGFNDTTTYEPKKKGYFFEGQVLIENVQGGARFVNGYKFGRFGYLGVGVGFDRVFSNPFNKKINGLHKKALAGVYMPLYVYYAADGPSKRHVTPFFALEAGYAMAFRGMDEEFSTDEFGNKLKGGPMGGVGLGFKMKSRRHKGHFSILFNVNYKWVDYERTGLILNSSGQTTGSFTTNEVGHLVIPGIRLGLGF